MLKPVPVRLQKRISEIGGLNPHGQPLFRVVRGSDRMTWIGGAWRDHDSNGNFLREVVETRQVPKYPDALERYVFEGWMPPENYGTEQEWKENFTKIIAGQFVEELGEYPRHGEYELIKVIETPKAKAFVPLTEAICDALVTTAKANRELSVNVKMEFIRRRNEREAEAKETRLIDAIEGMSRPDWAINGKPHIVVPDMKDILKYA